MSLEGKVVVITGAAKGIGRYLASNFAAKGVKLVLADVDQMDAVAAEVAELGAEAITVPTDICEEKQVQFLMQEAYRRYSRIDVLINNAAITAHFHLGAPRWPRIRSMDRELMQNVIDTNIIGAMLCTKHAIPYMESLNEGHIINIGQAVTRDPSRPTAIGMCLHDIGKIGVTIFTRGVAEEEREFGICVVSMGPGTGATLGVTAPRVGSTGSRAGAGGGGLVLRDAPEWARSQVGIRDEATIGDRYLLAAEAPMEMSGHQISVADGQLVIFD